MKEMALMECFKTVHFHHFLSKATINLKNLEKVPLQEMFFGHLLQLIFQHLILDEVIQSTFDAIVCQHVIFVAMPWDEVVPGFHVSPLGELFSHFSVKG